MATTLYMSPISLIVQYLTQLGLLAAGGTLNTYVGGSVGTPVTTYTDSTGLVANPNPMTLSAAARPVSSTGAPTAFWAPSGTLIKLNVVDANSNQLVVLDNIPLLNDPAATNSLAIALANPAAGEGASLVANAMISYSNVAAMRAGGTPAPVAGQTLIVATQGLNSNGDGLGALYYWSASSSATDNGVTIIAPSGAVTGRYLLVGQQGSPLVQNIQKANYTTVLQDGNGQIYSDGSVADTWTIAANSAVPYPIGTTLTFVNDSVGGANAMAIAINTDTLIWAQTGGTGTRSLAAGGMATALKVAAARWMISGGGLS